MCKLSETGECLSAKQERKSLRRHVWEDFKDMAYAFTHTEKGKSIYKRRKETVERSFADSKELHGLRYCHMRGLSKSLCKIFCKYRRNVV